MYLLHSVIGEDDIFKILKDGYLRSSFETKNAKMFDPKGSKYIYIRLNKQGEYAHFNLDKNLLLENIFYLNTGWHGEPLGEKIDGRKLNEKELDEILKNFRARVNKYYREYDKTWSKEMKGSLPVQMSNEILVEKKISLKKYLRKINKYNCSQDEYNYIVKKYKDVKLSCYKIS